MASSGLEIYKGKKVFVTGASGFLGGHIMSRLLRLGCKADGFGRELDLTKKSPSTILYKPDLIIHLAAHVAGIAKNRLHPYEFLLQNALMAINITEFALDQKSAILAAGSVCMYPEKTPIPFNEDNMMKAMPEPTNIGYGLGKRFMLNTLQLANQQYGLRYGCLVSANLYGPGDNFSPQSGHVIPNLIQKVYDAIADKKDSIAIYGTGKATRDFLYIEDAADAYIMAGAHLLEHPDSFVCNIGSGQEIMISTLLAMIMDVIGCKLVVEHDTTMPDGQMRRLVNSLRAEKLLGWKAKTRMRDGIERTVRWYAEQTGKDQEVLLQS